MTRSQAAINGANMTGSFATFLFRLTFALAGCYNLAFGLWSAFFPLHFFQIAEIEPPRYPAIWACLGMVVGIYGLLYWCAAWKPDRGWAIIAVGLLGKVLGPIGMFITIGEHWPPRLAMLNLYNDVIWWLPFGLFLVRGTTLARWLVTIAPWCCATLHSIAFVGMAALLQGGMVAEPDLVQRARYIADHPGAWTTGWCFWMASALSLIAFYAWWGGRLATPRWASAGVLLAASGSVFDLSGEFLSVIGLRDSALSMLANSDASLAAGFAAIERTATLLTAGFANTLYTVGGCVLMLKTTNLPRNVRLAMWTTWIAGVGMTVAAVAHSPGGLVVSSIVLFPLLIGWNVWMAVKWKAT